MYRIRFHGRGGQGMKTASRILGTAFFIQGYEVQDAPRYGAERRGAPIFAFVRADHQPIYERGVISHPDLVIIADDTLVPVPAAAVTAGVVKNTVVLINSDETPDTWKHRLNIDSQVFTLPVETEDRAELRFIGATCAGAAARLSSISRTSLQQAIEQELGTLGKAVVDKNLSKALAAYDAMADHEGSVTEGSKTSASNYRKPNWVDLPFEEARVSAPDIFSAANSVQVNTGVWRSQRPVIDYDRCGRCWWVCSTFCPDGAIRVEDNTPIIDYEHCKGCLVCVAQCPPHAIEAVDEKAHRRKPHETPVTHR